MSATVRVLRDAADILEQDGWCQHLLRDKDGRHCVVGAFEDTGAPLSDYLAACYALETGAGLDVGRLSTWNDQPGQTAENVIDTIRGLADRLDAS